MNNTASAFVKLARFAVAGTVLAGAGIAHGALVEIPQTALSSSPGVYTDGGYYTDDLGPNIVTTGGGNAANVGGADGRNDDGFMELNLGFDITFFGSTYSSLFINNNGNVSFVSGIDAYEPEGPTGADAPVISPFFGDVDTRSSAGVVHYNLSDNQLVVTWDQVGWFNNQADPTNSFQLVLRGDDYAVPTGEGSIGFFYQMMGWDSTGTNSVAAAGFGDGEGNGQVIEGSLFSGLNDVLEETYIWFDANLDPVPPTHSVPEPGTFGLLALGMAAFGLARRRKVIA